MGITKSDLNDISQGDSTLGNWYVNIFTVDRRKAIVFVNERTLLSFIVYGINKKNIKEIKETFNRKLIQLLTIEGFNGKEVEHAIKGSEEIQFTTTNSKTILGNVTDIVNMYKYMIPYEGGLKSCNLTEIISQMNRTPQRNLNWAYSIDVVKEIITMKTA